MCGFVLQLGKTLFLRCGIGWLIVWMHFTYDYILIRWIEGDALARAFVCLNYVIYKDRLIINIIIHYLDHSIVLIMYDQLCSIVHMDINLNCK